MLACLGDPSRFRVVATLAAGEQCVTSLAERIGLSQSCTTRHLQVLQREGIVRGRRQGKRVVYCLRKDEPLAGGLVDWILSHEAKAAEHAVPAHPPDEGGRARSGRVLGGDVHADAPVMADDWGPATPDASWVDAPAEDTRSASTPGDPSPPESAARDSSRVPSRPGDLEDFLL